MSAAPEKFKLTDEERSRIRWSSTKRGFLSVFEFVPGSRGGRFRKERTAIKVTLPEAERSRDSQEARYATPVARVRTYEVDAMGRVQREVTS